MNRREYIEAVKNELGFMPQSEVEKAEEYFNSFFCGSLDDDAVIQNLGSPKDAAKRYYRATSPNADSARGAETKKAEPNRRGSYTGVVTAVLLAVFLFPIWLPVLIAVVTIVFVLLILAVAVCFGLWLGGGAVVFTSLFAGITVYDKLLQCGAGLIMFGIGLMLSWLLVRAFIELSIWIIRKITRS